jgi:uncharacterized membrane protein YdjX (TVP38/TMEM64 family)
MKKTKIIITLMIFTIVGFYFYYDFSEILNLEYLKDNKESFNNYYLKNQTLTILMYFFIYILVTALSLPGATILTLFGGAIFGFEVGFIVISFASTIGASIAFLSSRYLFRDYFNKRFKKQLAKVNEGINREGSLYLFTLRLMPIVPFFIINLVMGLTEFKLLRYYLISQIAMAPATIVYVNAGLQIGSINNISDVFTLEVFISLFIIGFLPILSKQLIKVIQRALKEK